ncbi:MAG: hypothetical protein K1X89_14860 [Myxococcaceae bacterium]|nr:hypothetical protein [Myxococcaceae bacterium]
MILRSFLAVAAVVAVLSVAPGCGGGGGGSSGGGGGSSNKPTLTGQYAFDAGFLSASTQTGGGASAGDNFSIIIGDSCDFDRPHELVIYLGARDHTKLTAGTFTVEPRSAADGGNRFATLEYSDNGTKPLTLNAVSGSVTMDVIDFSRLLNAKGSFDVVLGLPDAGTSPLKGTFVLDYACQ